MPTLLQLWGGQVPLQLPGHPFRTPTTPSYYSDMHRLFQPLKSLRVPTEFVSGSRSGAFFLFGLVHAVVQAWVVVTNSNLTGM